MAAHERTVGSAPAPPAAKAEASAAGQGPAFDQQEAWVFFEGEPRRYRDAHIGVMTHALHYGTGCFEGIRAFWSAPREQLYVFRARDHFQLLRQSTSILRMALPHSADELTEITVDLLRRNRFRTDTYIRPLVYKASEEIGVRLHDLEDGFLIYAQPFGEYHDRSRGLRCMVSSWRRVDDNAAPARAKVTGVYINSALAKTEAFDNGVDEAILLGQDGHVCEGSADNLFIIRKGALITPPVSDNILEGITRATLIQIWTEELGLPLVERSIDRTELYIADEVILCATAAQVCPVVEIDHRPVGDGTVGPFARRLDEIYSSLVRGEIEKYREWCHPVY